MNRLEHHGSPAEPDEQSHNSRQKVRGSFSYVLAVLSWASHLPGSIDSLLTPELSRLEAATSRLEDIASTVDGASPQANAHPSIAGIAAVGAGGGAAAATATEAPAPSPPEPLPRSIEDFDKLIEEDVTAFVTASSKVGGLVEEQVW